jgi:hypothetical protein
MDSMPFSEQFEKYYYESGRDVCGNVFAKNGSGFYRSKNTYREYTWFAHGYREAMQSKKPSPHPDK